MIAYSYTMLYLQSTNQHNCHFYAPQRTTMSVVLGTKIDGGREGKGVWDASIMYVF